MITDPFSQGKVHCLMEETNLGPDPTLELILIVNM